MPKVKVLEKYFINFRHLIYYPMTSFNSLKLRYEIRSSDIIPMIFSGYLSRQNTGL